MTSDFQSDSFVFFGATGDLAHKQIFPALQGLIRDERRIFCCGFLDSYQVTSCSTACHLSDANAELPSEFREVIWTTL